MACPSTKRNAPCGFVLLALLDNRTLVRDLIRSRSKSTPEG